MRVLTVLEILQAKGRVTAGELVDRLEVSTRTVQRYVARLQDLGIPVSSTRGRGAEYRLRPGFRMPPIMLNTEEAFAVALGLNALQHVGLAALAPAVVGVETKLGRVMPAELWERMQALSAALHLEKPMWAAAVDTALITELAAASQAQRQVTLHYQNVQGVTTERTVQPLGLVREGETWFLAAYCLWRQDQRLFRVDRISTARMTQQTFDWPEAFDPKEWVQKKLQNVPSRWQTEIWLDANPESLRYDLLPARAHVAGENGGLVLRCGVNDLEGLAARLLELGCRFELRSPPELRHAFRRVAERALRVSQNET